ncbi:protein TILLER ANGLE CONTROL 1-like [Curcuma longa]|uniref:protein TILLER ANGLE CONTROL 1-like n=1 Tax=Curcuma longa TaxID=136217 RepID=UPI003D9F9FC2
MKILFDWMHRKLHPVVAEYSQVPQRKDEEDEKIEGMVVEEQEALLLHDMLHGILSIGTLGQFEDPFLHDLPHDIEEPIQPISKKEQQEEVATPVIQPVQPMNKKGEAKGNQKVATLIEVEAKLLREDWPLLREDKERGERKRTTLADLFAADPIVKEEHKGSKNNSTKGLHHVKKKKTRDTIKACTNSSNKNNKLQKLMTSMLKKKIHPENINMATEADVQRSSSIYW